MEFLNYAEEQLDIKLDNNFIIFFDSNILFYLNNENQKCTVHYFNIITKNHKYFYCCNGIMDMLLFDNSNYPKIITCSNNGDIILYNLLEKKINFNILFSDKNIIIRKLLKINKNKILLFMDWKIFYIFDINKKQIEVKLKFTEDIYPFLFLIFNDYRTNFFERGPVDIKIQPEQINILAKFKIINTKNIEDRITIKDKIYNNYSTITYINLNIYHFGKKGLEIYEKNIDIKKLIKWLFCLDYGDIDDYCYILKNNKFFFILEAEDTHYEIKHSSFELYNFNTGKLSYYEFPDCSSYESLEYEFYAFNEKDNKIYLFKTNGDYNVIDENSFS